MANDKLVDSGKLDAALTATANAIRAKTGDTAQIPFDYTTETGFKSAIEAITGGGGEYDIIATIVGETQTLAITDASGGSRGFELVGTYTPASSATNFATNFFKSSGYGYKAKYTNGMVLIKSSEETFARNGFIEGIFVYTSTYFMIPSWIGCRTGFTTPMQTSSRAKTARTDTGSNAYIDSSGAGLGSNTYFGTISGADFDVYEMEIPQEIAEMLMVNPA